MYQQYLKLLSSWKLVPEKEYRVYISLQTVEGVLTVVYQKLLWEYVPWEKFFILDLDLGGFVVVAVVLVAFAVLVLVRKWNNYMWETQQSHLKVYSKPGIPCIL